MCIRDRREDFLFKRLLSRELAESLGLSEEQREKLRTGLEELHEKQVELSRQLARSARLQAARLTEQKVDEEAVMREVEESGRLRTEIAKLRMRALLLVRATLTPEQFRALRDVIGGQLRQKRDREDGGAAGERREGPPGWKRLPWGKGRERGDHHKPEGNGTKGKGSQDVRPSPSMPEGMLPVVER
ncbi:MAG: Spy/CpxP family protein refolding chaperone, partial [Kiritimatiellae bacterium]|nr:Spy/CpxP family protein refolding chaperone [Kiritimatiellia bacterium]